MTYIETYEKWLESPYVSDADKQVLESMTDAEIYEAFYKTSEFGTGGMRGVMGVGTNRINIYTVRMATKSIAEMLKARPERPIKDGWIGNLKAKIKAEFASESDDERVKTAKDTPRKVHESEYDRIPKVVIAFDTRNGSEDFAKEAAKVLAAEGVIAYLFDRPSPVPLLSFAVRELKADGGIVITASHNSKEYNGFKAYDSTGCQMLPEETEIVASGMEALEDPLAIESMNMDDAIIDAKLIVPLGKEIIERYMEAIADCGLIGEADGNKDSHTDSLDNMQLKLVYTPLHGSGRDYVMNALLRAGFGDVTLVREQADFNGDFPTVSKPNPEDRKALEIAVDKACEIDADIVIGTDPDCDRVGVAVIKKHAECDEPRADYLTGNQIGALLIDYLCECHDCGGDPCETVNTLKDDVVTEAGDEPRGEDFVVEKKQRRLITTIVTGAMGLLIAERHGIDVSLVLTGFKYIGGVMNEMEADKWKDEFFMGYEESYGYLLDTHARDKDGVSAALAICRMAAHYKAEGKTLTDRLEELYEEYGYWLDCQESFVFEGSEGEKIMADIMAEFREKKDALFDCFCEESGLRVKYGDFLDEGSGLPSADVLKYVFDDGSFVAIRPSGTEPKIKIYYCMGDENPLKPYEKQRAVAECIHRLTDGFGD